jgi:Ca2+-binding EF-hand superfamily protein
MHLRTLKDESKIKEAFDQFDVNGDGVVSKAELVSYVAVVWFAPGQGRKSADTSPFRYKHCGPAEDTMKTWPKAAHWSWCRGLRRGNQSTAETEATWEALDEDKDGQVTYEEFRSFWKRNSIV